MASILKTYDNLSGQIGHLLKDPVMLLIRLYWGYNLIVNGYTKLNDTKATQTFFHSIGLPPVLGYVVGLLEIVSGVHYIIGLTTQFATLVVVVITLNAYVFAHRDGLLALFSQPSKFIHQPPFLFLLTALFIHYAGPGNFSLDKVLLGQASPPRHNKYE